MGRWADFFSRRDVKKAVKDVEKNINALKANTFEYTKVPNSKKNFFQNYSDHLEFLDIQFGKKWNDLLKTPSLPEALSFVSQETINRLNIFEKLRDGHDYFDEVVGATAIPALAMVVSVTTAALAAWEALQFLAIKTGLVKSDHKDHADRAANYFLLVGISFLAGAVSFLKSALSMITRPVVTAIQGFEKQNSNRFYHEDNIGGLLSDDQNEALTQQGYNYLTR